MSVEFLLVSVVSFASNLPLGVWRERVRKFSPEWFVAVHLSLPLVFALRVTLDIPILAVPGFIGLAVAGQFIGARWWRRTLPAHPGADSPQ